MTALRAEGVHRSFDHPSGAVHVLRGVDLEVAAGELVTLAGPSGQGRSALITLLCGFDQPDKGTIEVCRRSLTTPPSWRLCAVLPQALGLAGELTPAENIALPLRLDPTRRGHPVGDAVDDLMAELGIDGLGDRYPAEVSFGRQQRAAPARAVIALPEVLLADEPTAHLDQRSAPASVAALRRAADTGSAVLVATHHDLVHLAADRTLVLDNGIVSVH
ncbi:ATP-binding cassette domain-containing protein [Umezawaea sp. Da 62-37]|uniref:ABC transporter ATP-binding protein n=1 Tax=Umezawaea sp. Da 62-37 TaxID=3075927 RepID=UPI0028F74D65|nr:ATP-binding cassette domain-containing protein [Umezawaea sp. Da 62-37]WNV84603.1 ATP-binding cassette domain-containing protein [Umezawaea sp. Da 62-37]